MTAFPTTQQKAMHGSSGSQHTAVVMACTYLAACMPIRLARCSSTCVVVVSGWNAAVVRQGADATSYISVPCAQYVDRDNYQMCCLQDMRFDNTFVRELPGDKETSNLLRQVRLLSQQMQASRLAGKLSLLIAAQFQHAAALLNAWSAVQQIAVGCLHVAPAGC